MEKMHFPSDREYDHRPFRALFFPDEYNSEMQFVDDYSEPEYDDLVPPDELEEQF